MAPGGERPLPRQAGRHSGPSRLPSDELEDRAELFETTAPVITVQLLFTRSKNPGPTLGNSRRANEAAITTLLRRSN